MQVNAIFRRGIVLARTPDTLAAILANNVRPDSDVIYVPIPDSLFATLWHGRLFAELNKACATMIDDYEEELLPVESITAAEAILKMRIRAGESYDEEQQFYRELLTLLNDARRRKYPVLFVL